MTREIKFSKQPTKSFLRNGTINTIGIDFTAFGINDTIDIFAVTSRGHIARGCIQFPKDKIPEVIQALKDIYQTMP